MALLMYSSLGTNHGSTQAYLGSVKSCPGCKGQKPKHTFMVVDGEAICEDCRLEIELDAEDRRYDTDL